MGWVGGGMSRCGKWRLSSLLVILIFAELVAICAAEGNFEVVCSVTFHFKESRLSHLRKVLENVLSYQTSVVKVFVTTNDVSRTQSALDMMFGLSTGSIRVVSPPTSLLEDPLKLTWHHRAIFLEEHEKRSRRDDVVYLYLEDDILLPWAHLDHWHNFADKLFVSTKLVPSFYRKDGDPRSPSLGMLTDQHENCNNAHFNPAETLIHLSGTDQHFVQLQNPYSASFALTGTMMDDFLASPEYDLKYMEEFRNPMNWKTRELAASGMQFVDFKDGGVLQERIRSRGSSAVVFSDGQGQPLEVGAVYHLDVSLSSPNFCYALKQMEGNDGGPSHEL